MFRNLKFIIYTRPFIMLAFLFARAYCMTFRMNIVNEERWLDLLKNGKRVLLCGWHQQFFSIIRHFKNYAHLKPKLMISQSRDGEIIARIAHLTGWETARGSSSKGGKEALTEMIMHLKSSGFALQILDGPRGPMGNIKPGVIKMAGESGAALVPLYLSSDNSWFFNSWDRFMLPKPFSKVTLFFDEPIFVEAAQSPEQFERQRRELEKRMRPHLFRYEEP